MSFLGACRLLVRHSAGLAMFTSLDDSEDDYSPGALGGVWLNEQRHLDRDINTLKSTPTADTLKSSRPDADKTASG